MPRTAGPPVVSSSTTPCSASFAISTRFSSSIACRASVRRSASQGSGAGPAGAAAGAVQSTTRVVMGLPSSSGCGCVHLAHAEREFLTRGAAAALAHRQAQVQHPAAKLALAQAGQYQVGGCLLAGAAAGAMVDVLAEVIDATPEAVGRFRSLPQHPHHLLSDCAVALRTLHGVAGAGCNRVDEHQAQRQPELLPQRCIGLFGHGNELL